MANNNFTVSPTLAGWQLSHATRPSGLGPPAPDSTHRPCVSYSLLFNLSLRQTGHVSLQLYARLLDRIPTGCRAADAFAYGTRDPHGHLKRKFAAKLEAAGGLIQPAPPRVRKSTKAKRVEQLREQAIAQGMRYTAVIKASFRRQFIIQQRHELRDQVEELKGQLAAKQHLIRKQRWQLIQRS